MDSQISETDLLKWNRMGLVPGPEETEEMYLKRVEYCLQLKSDIAEQMGLKNVLESTSELSEKLIHDVSSETKFLYDVIPSWCPILFTNYHLAPWHGGCAWIFKVSDDMPTGAFLQLRAIFAKQEKYFFYPRQELVTHESAHVGRMLFEEPKFEEILAYRTSKSRLRRWLGAIFQTSWETAFVFFVLLINIFTDYIFFGTDPNDFLHIDEWVDFFTVLLIGYGVIRLIIRQKQLQRCLNNLESILGSTEKANAVIYRLTDHEIITFSKSLPQAIINYAKQQTSFRWRLINLAYFSTNTQR